jgi:hypothetical protein
MPFGTASLKSWTRAVAKEQTQKKAFHEVTLVFHNKISIQNYVNIRINKTDHIKELLLFTLYN